MKFTPLHQVPPPLSGGKGKWMVLLEEFLAAGSPAAVVTLDGANPRFVYSAIRTTLRHVKLPVHVWLRQNQVYLERLDTEERT